MHNIGNINGKDMYIGKMDAWHTLGKVTGKFQTWEELVEFGLNFPVEKQQLFDSRGNPIEAWGTFRDGNVFLATVGERYEVVHHSKGFEMVDALIGQQNGAHFSTAGALGKGETVWGLADLNIPLKVGEDVSNNYLLFWTGYDGKSAHSYGLTSVRVVCQNTLRTALSNKTASLFKVRHTKAAHAQIEKAHVALNQITDEVKTMEEKLNFLASKQMTREASVNLLDRLFPKTEKEYGRSDSSTRRDNILVEILNKYESNDNNTFPEQRGTAYNMLNAITNYTDHVRSTKGGDKGRSESAVFGSGERLKSQAFEVLMETAGGLPSVQTRTTYVEVPAMPVVSGSLLDQVLEVTGK